MKKIIALMICSLSILASAAIGTHKSNNSKPAKAKSMMETMGLKRIEMPGNREAYVKTEEDEATVYAQVTRRSNCHIEVNKEEMRLYVFEDRGGQKTLIAHYPVCVGLALGNKEKEGDMKTPTCTAEDPFEITQIVKACNWKHDFGDGRGSILAYGDWFLRLDTHGHKGIGIHGSTNNEQTVPGRASEGCIRMRDADIRHLKNNYAFVGMKVIVVGD